MGDKLKRCGPAAEAQMMSENVRPSYRISPTERLAKYDCRADRQVERGVFVRTLTACGQVTGGAYGWTRRLVELILLHGRLAGSSPSLWADGSARAQSITLVELQEAGEVVPSVSAPKE